ncbi:MAG TPA: TatD family hydrolase [Firmicutes bacterium]|nr:TatD family hydrolase [Bacillota bacterium]
MLIDSHCHLNDDTFSGDSGDVLRRAAEQGVTDVVVPGYDLTSSRRAVAMLASMGRGPVRLHAAVGVHPHEARGFGRQEEAEVRTLARHPGVVAIGETGLDFHYDHSPRAAQVDAFRRHLALGAELGLPVIVHSREAEAETLEILQASGVGATGGPRVVLHCFMGSLPYATRALELGCFLSVAGPITFRKLDGLRAVVASVPMDRLMVETDSPYLTPEPNRGRRNEPARVADVARKLAEIRGLSLGEVARSTTEVARVFFRLDPSAGARD